MQVFNIWIKLLQYYGSKSGKFETHVGPIIKTCVLYLHQGKNVSAKEKERAVQVLQEIVQNQLFDNTTIATDITADILKLFNIKKPPATLTSQIFRLLGLIAKHYKHLISSKVDNIRDIYMKTIESIILHDEAVSFSTNSVNNVQIANNYFS